MKLDYYSLSRINAHLMFPLFLNVLVVKYLEKSNLLAFKFYPSKLTNNVSPYGIMLNFLCFFVTFIAVKIDSKLTIRYMEKNYII